MGFGGRSFDRCWRGKSAYQVAKEIGGNVATIGDWLNKHKSGSLVLDGSEGEPKPGSRSPVEKLALLMQSKPLAEAERGDWLRHNGLHSQHLSL